jgi:hypothetical protein
MVLMGFLPGLIQRDPNSVGLILLQTKPTKSRRRGEAFAASLRSLEQLIWCVAKEQL